MMLPARLPVLLCAISAFLVGGCGGSVEDPARAQATYGASVDATESIPAPAVAAEESLYVGHALTLDGRISAVMADDCELQLEAGGEAPIFVRAARSEDGSCTWKVPGDAGGFAVAAGTLRTSGDMLRFIANGVRVTPVRLSNPDS